LLESNVLVSSLVWIFFSSLNFRYSSLITHHLLFITHHSSLKISYPFGFCFHFLSLKYFYCLWDPLSEHHVSEYSYPTCLPQLFSFHFLLFQSPLPCYSPNTNPNPGKIKDDWCSSGVDWCSGSGDLPPSTCSGVDRLPSPTFSIQCRSPCFIGVDF